MNIGLYAVMQVCVPKLTASAENL